MFLLSKSVKIRAIRVSLNKNASNQRFEAFASIRFSRADAKSLLCCSSV